MGGNNMTFLKRVAGAVTLGAALLLGSSPISSPAQAGYVVTLEEVGSAVVATGSGPLDLTGLSGPASAFVLSLVIPVQAAILTGPPTFNSFDVYTGITGPTSFGNGGLNDADNGGGD